MRGWRGRGRGGRGSEGPGGGWGWSLLGFWASEGLGGEGWIVCVTHCMTLGVRKDEVAGVTHGARCCRIYVASRTAEILQLGLGVTNDV